ncbi:MAG: PQQ-dependent sugar dehydrogenase [Cyclobacteriaceae bacterium]|nr:PQQ-dependent sugar dehydrogenase [Cyclobacteriaceae bacterium]
MKKIYLAIIACMWVSLSLAQKPVIESSQMSFTVDTVVTGLGVLWSFEFISDDEVLLAEREGRMKIYNLGTKELRDVEGLPEIVAKGQGGLFDIELHPDYKNNKFIYFSYSSPKQDGEEGEGQNTAFMRARIKKDKLVNKELIFKALPNYETNHHFGGRIEFDREGYLYLSVGDRGGRDFVQEMNNNRGKIFRLHDDGAVPKDNPYVNTPGVKPEIYSNGHRNQQGMAMNPETGEIWEHEHGPMGGDEINIIKPGVNYGWPTISYGVNYNGTSFTDLTEQEDMSQPLYYWLPSIAPCGMEFVTSDKYPNWKGDLLVGSLKFRNLVHCEIYESRVLHEEVVLEGIGRVRSIRQGPDGFIYVGTEGPGMLVRLVPAEKVEEEK